MSQSYPDMCKKCGNLIRINRGDEHFGIKPYCDDCYRDPEKLAEFINYGEPCKCGHGTQVHYGHQGSKDRWCVMLGCRCNKYVRCSSNPQDEIDSIIANALMADPNIKNFDLEQMELDALNGSTTKAEVLLLIAKIREMGNNMTEVLLKTKEPELTPGEIAALQAIDAAMKSILYIDEDELAANTNELTTAIHTLQQFVSNHVLNRLMPTVFSKWYHK